MANGEKSDTQDLIELLKTDPDAAFEKMGMPIDRSPEHAAEVEREYAGLSYDEIRAKWLSRVEAGKRALDEKESKGSDS